MIGCIRMLTTVDVEKDYVVDENIAKIIVMELDHDGFQFKLFLCGQHANELNEFMNFGMSYNACVMMLLVMAQYETQYCIRAYPISIGPPAIMSPLSGHPPDVQSWA